MLVHEHPFGVMEILRPYINVGPFGMDGGLETVNNQGFSYSKSGEYKIKFGPSTRRIIDLSDVENNSWGIIPTGQSGSPFSRYYDDQAEKYSRGELRKMMLSVEEIKSNFVHRMRIHPTPKNDI